MSNAETEITSRKDAPVILAIETATRAGGVAVARGPQILASTIGDASASHSTDLIKNIDLVLRKSELRLTDVEVFAAAVGPGSFTGLRIGLATVKSLAVALNKKCVAVSTLAAVARSVGTSPARIVALLPAGRGELFAQMFTVMAGRAIPQDEAMHISPQTLLSRYAEHSKIIWAGEGAQTQLELLQAEAERRANPDSGGGWSIAPDGGRLVESVVQLALNEYFEDRVIEPEELRANYVRPSDAEMKVHG